LVTFSGEAEKVTARRAGAKQSEATKLRRNYKQSNLRRRKHACTRIKAKPKQRATEDGRPYIRRKTGGNRDKGRRGRRPLQTQSPDKKQNPANLRRALTRLHLGQNQNAPLAKSNLL
jgi:hypothetical protein